MFYVTALTIAGSDCSGGAGIQADIKTFSALGVYSASVITAVTVQNTLGVQRVCSIPSDVVAAQLQSVLCDIHPMAVKIGMTDGQDTMQAIVDTLSSYHCGAIVIDPIMLSSSGMPLMQPDAQSFFCERLIPLATLLTPNMPEAEALADMPIHNRQDLRAAASRIAQRGCQHVLIKGGHVEGDIKNDYLFCFRDGKLSSEHVYAAATVTTRNTHGTGCTLSSAITAFLARGMAMPDAVDAAKTFTANALRYGANVNIGGGHGPLNHFFAPVSMIIKD